MAKNKDKVTLKETFQVHWRAYKTIRHFAPGTYASITLHGIASALTPYVVIWFSARIINELAGLRRPEELLQLVIAALLSGAGITLVTGLLQRWCNAMLARYSVRKYRMFADKMLSMDFADMDDAKTHDLRRQIDQSANWAGWGFDKLDACWGGFVSGCAGIIGAVALTVSLFTMQVPADSTLVFLNHPGFVAALVALIAAATVLGPICNNKSLGYWSAVAEDARFGNRVFGAFGFISSERQNVPVRTGTDGCLGGCGRKY